MSDAPGMDDKNFWNHHTHTHDDYIALASRVPDVMDLIESGRSLADVNADNELIATARQYFDPNKMIHVELGDDGTYRFSDEGRHRIMAAKELGLDIPVFVEGESENEDESIKKLFSSPYYGIYQPENAEMPSAVKEGFTAYPSEIVNSDTYLSSDTAGKEDENMSTYYQVRAMENPYAEDNDIELVRMRTLSGSNSKVIHPLMDEYQRSVQELNQSFDFQNSDADTYFKNLSAIQDELGYYPEFDPRMEEKYQQLRYERQSDYAEQFWAGQNAGAENTELRSMFDQGLAAIESQTRTELGYYNYSPNGISVFEDIAKENEEEIDMSAYAGMGSGEHYGVDSYLDLNTGEEIDMSAYAGMDSGEHYGADSYLDLNPGESVDMSTYADLNAEENGGAGESEGEEESSTYSY